MTMSQTDLERIARKVLKARITLLTGQPFFGSLALRLRMVAEESTPTLATDGEAIYYSPQFCDKLPVEQLRTALAHEVGHCIFEHVGRCGSRNPHKWNLATDHAVNLILEEAKFPPIPGYWNADKRFAGMTADAIYNLLNDNDAQQKELCELRPGKGSGQPRSEAEETKLRNDWKVATAQAAAAARGQGKLPGSLERFIDDVLTPKVDWRDQLRRFVTERSKNDYSWMRPNRMLASMGLFLPSLYSESMGTIVIVTDDSGSIDNDTLSAFQAEICAIRDAVAPELTVHISCDARINHVAEFAREDEFKIVSKGGGGTDFRPPFNWVEQRGIKPACFVYLTDLHGPTPQTPPDYPVLWCCTTKNVGPWGETLRIEV